ncbi:MAG: FAD-linked oxidase C-terminal domain-containing protein, partial [Rhodobacterales bacterium]
AMRAIKAALDPAGIMNPGAVLRGQAAGQGGGGPHPAGFAPPG